MGLKQRPQAALDGRDLAGKAIPIAVAGKGIPGAKELPADLKPRLAEAALVCEPFGVAAEVAQQMCPADLAPSGVKGVIGPPAI